MDLLEIVRNQVTSLPDGAHQAGLKSVLRHIEAAYRHLSRGQNEGDDSAFGDAIYRSNQAFEGSIKEAYRILAEKDPHKTTPYNIEQYLQRNNLFRPRVLAQFTNYRTEWRNPSTHDYNLDFDEDEAFLAIVSVSAFSKMLIDQIAERLAFVLVRDDVASQGAPEELRASNQPLIDEITDVILKFLGDYAPTRLPYDAQTETQFLGALSGYLSTVDPRLSISTNHVTKKAERALEFDMLVSRDDESLIVELKRGPNKRARENGLRYLERALQSSEIKAGILLIHQNVNKLYEVEERTLPREVVIKVIATPD
jgi:hypothetical protein